MSNSCVTRCPLCQLVLPTSIRRGLFPSIPNSRSEYLWTIKTQEYAKKSSRLSYAQAAPEEWKTLPVGGDSPAILRKLGTPLRIGTSLNDLREGTDLELETLRQKFALKC